MKRLIINLNNVIAWFEDDVNKTVIVMSDGVVNTFEQPDILGVVNNVEDLYKDPNLAPKYVSPSKG